MSNNVSWINLPGTFSLLYVSIGDEIKWLHCNCIPVLSDVQKYLLLLRHVIQYRLAHALPVPGVKFVGVKTGGAIM